MKYSPELMSDRADELRARILEMVSEYYSAAFPEREFIPGETPVPISGKVFDAAEIQLLVDAGLDFWLTTGRYAAQFEDEFARVFGLRYAMLTNSGSSANLLALSCLTSPSLKEKALWAGAAECGQTALGLKPWANASATGGAIAGACLGLRTLAASVLSGSWAIFHSATITSTPTRT